MAGPATRTHRLRRRRRGRARAGLGVALTAYFATRPSTQVGKISAATNAALAALVALVQIEVQLSIVLIVAGSVILATLGWAAKRVFGSSREIPAIDTQPDGTAGAMATTPHEGSDTKSPPTMAYAPPQKTNGLAIAPLILGLTWIFWIGSLLAVIFGHIALSQNDDSGGRGMATAGLVLGYIGLGVAALIAVLLVVESANW